MTESAVPDRRLGSSVRGRYIGHVCLWRTLNRSAPFTNYLELQAGG